MKIQIVSFQSKKQVGLLSSVVKMFATIAKDTCVYDPIMLCKKNFLFPIQGNFPVKECTVYVGVISQVNFVSPYGNWDMGKWCKNAIILTPGLAMSTRLSFISYPGVSCLLPVSMTHYGRLTRYHVQQNLRSSKVLDRDPSPSIKIMWAPNAGELRGVGWKCQIWSQRISEFSFQAKEEQQFLSPIHQAREPQDSRQVPVS